MPLWARWAVTAAIALAGLAIWWHLRIAYLGAEHRYRRWLYFGRRPVRSSRRDAKRQAHAYAEEVAGRSLSWKAARKLLARLERDGRELMSAGSGEDPE